MPPLLNIQHNAGVFPIDEADRCVKCALCLPHCPTYELTHDESESPRGRIALMQGLASGELEAGERLAAHLDHCLACRACEAVCPAEVPYGRLIDAARATMVNAGRRPRLRFISLLARHPSSLALAAVLLRLAGSLGLTKLATRVGPSSVRRLARYAPPPARRARPPKRRPPETRREAALFLGCIARPFDTETRRAAISVLEKLGVTVRIPRGQTCCGALDLHNGRPVLARRAAKRNISAFAATPAVDCISTASGCGATLMEYGALEAESGAKFAQRVRDINGYVAALLERQEQTLRPVRQTVLLHTPCTLANVVKDAEAPLRLLQRIPGLDVVRMPLGCCGAAGSYMLSEPETADRLVSGLVERARTLMPAAIATSNIGCALHIRAALSAAGLAIPVKHPVALIDAQLQ